MCDRCMCRVCPRVCVLTRRSRDYFLSGSWGRGRGLHIYSLSIKGRYFAPMLNLWIRWEAASVQVLRNACGNVGKPFNVPAFIQKYILASLYENLGKKVQCFCWNDIHRFNHCCSLSQLCSGEGRVTAWMGCQFFNMNMHLFLLSRGNKQRN